MSRGTQPTATPPLANGLWLLLHDEGSVQDVPPDVCLHGLT